MREPTLYRRTVLCQIFPDPDRYLFISGLAGPARDVAGLTRDGVYMVEDGEVRGLVNNFRFNESPVDLLQRFSAASATVPSFSREWGDDYFSRTATPALRVPDFNMSSVSQAL